MNINECNLDAKFFEDIFEKFHDDYEAPFDEMYNFLPNVPRVKEILGDATKKIVAEGENWFAILQGDLGDRAVIDSTNLENALVNGNEDARAAWAEHIHKKLQDSTDFRMWRVAPKRYHKGFCPTICKSQRSAEHEKERLESISGFGWKITVIEE